jgi:hypothetical protein
MRVPPSAPTAAGPGGRGRSRRKPHLYGKPTRQNVLFCAVATDRQLTVEAVPNGGYTRVSRTEGLLRSVIGAVVQGSRRRENPSSGCGHGFLGLSPEAVQFFKGLQADNTKAY